MMQRVILYISAATDLEQERDLLARAVAEMPGDLEWRIVQSPRKSQPLDMAAVTHADVHLLLLGSDIRAPVGQEWLLAVRASRLPLMFLKERVTRTLAAMDFVRFVERRQPWRRFVDAADLRRQAMIHLSTWILDRTPRFGLTPNEIEHLKTFSGELEQRAEEMAVAQERGAGESGLIFSRTRHEPSAGLLLDRREEDE